MTQIFTVTNRNLADVPEILRWFLATPERAAVWRILAFLQEAAASAIYRCYPARKNPPVF